MFKFFQNFTLSLLIIITPLTGMSIPSNGFQLKDFKITKVNANTIKMKYGKNLAHIEALPNSRFKINGMIVQWNKSDTLESAYSKVQKAYRASKKKNTFLEQLIISEAQARPPLLFMGLFGGLLGFGFGRATCKKTAAPSASGFNQAVAN